VTNNGMVAVNIRVEPGPLGSISSSHYTIYPLSANIAIGGSNTFTIDLDVPPEVTDGSYLGIIKFYADDGNLSYDTGEAFADLNIALTIGSVVNDIEVTAEATTSTMGDPIFVTLKAKDSYGNIVLSYDTAVAITVSESSAGLIPNSWILSTNGAPGGPSTSLVEMFGGIGNFTVDAQEPETLTVDVDGAVSAPLQYEFLPNASAGATKFAIIGPETAYTGPGGTLVWIAAVDSDGEVDPDYNSTVDLTVDNGATIQGQGSSWTDAPMANGQIQIMVIKSSPGATVTVQASETGKTTGSLDIVFADVDEYLVNGTTGEQTFSVQGDTMEFKIQAVESGSIVRSYNESATFTSESDYFYLSGPNVSGTTVTFSDGLADVTLNRGAEDMFPKWMKITENDTSSIYTADININFQSDDIVPPEVIRAEMDTPWIVHLYFSEDLDSGTAGTEENYIVPTAEVNKVCWYGDHVTLHLDAIPDSPFVVTINNVQDQATPAKNTITSGYTTSSITVPDIDYQGAAGSISDWFEVQVSDTSPSVGDTVHVTVYHKNVCGYLSGANSDNKNSDVSSVHIEYTGEGYLSGSPQSDASMSDGRADFDITIGNFSGTVTISASGGSPSVSTTQVAILNIQL
ncbi:MAG: hypothetical protein KAS92_03200, partial [Candidatus Omnitrophica bacterium]|nr:hypothetical protein [Candidatus Omnitrophota bacterium]